ncbi:hypothetical protein GCM10027278_37790 [Paralcaligenes ginsengisoli]
MWTLLWPKISKYVIGAGILVALVLAVLGYGHHQYTAGHVQAKADAAVAARSLEIAMQEEKDRADANHRGAVLARQAAEKTADAERARLDGLLQHYRRLAKAAGAGGRPDATGPDWIGVFGACYAEYAELGKDAGQLADQVNGLQGYIQAIRK